MTEEHKRVLSLQMPANRHTDTQADKQAGKQAASQPFTQSGKQANSQAARQRQTGRQGETAEEPECVLSSDKSCRQNCVQTQRNTADKKTPELELSSKESDHTHLKLTSASIVDVLVDDKGDS